MKQEEHVCPTCGQGTGYFSTMNGGLCQTVIMIAKAIKEKGTNVINIRAEMVNTGKMPITNYTNIAHLTRLGLIAKVADEKGNYCLTRRAFDFFHGGQIPRWVRVEKKTKTHGSRKVESSDEFVTISNFPKHVTDWNGIGYEVKEGRVLATV